LKVSLKWLKEYIDLEGISLELIEEKLTTAGLEVENIVDQSSMYDKFVVGYVKEKKSHPKADKLSLCKVNVGGNELNIVCGAPNVAEGQKVPVALIGAIIPEAGFKISKTKIRGEISEGMICSEKELEISDDHSGIMVLNDNLIPGANLSEVLKLNDVILEIGITPNRADALSHFGIARDLAALFDRQLKLPKINYDDSDVQISNLASVEIENYINCPRYTATLVKNVTVKESPEWLKEKLNAVGLRPINNIVDVTNFVLHEIGQPLHAFDLDKLSGRKIIVKNAGDIIKFTTLDSKERELKSDDLMICDGEKPVALAGIMGGENSEISETTKSVLIESAYFNPTVIRKTAKRLGLSTDASYRFERGCNPEITTYAAKRAALLIAEVSGGEVVPDILDVYPKEIIKKEINFRFNRNTKILGYEIPKNEIKKIFANLGMQILKESDDSLVVVVPLYRPDIEREIDLIEETARIYGYDKIPMVEKISITLDHKEDQTDHIGKLRDSLVSLGFRECINISLISEKEAERFGKQINLLNPQSAEMTTLRTSLIPGMLQTVSRNISVNEKHLRLFEIGNIFLRKSESIFSFDDFIEKEYAILILTGKKNEFVWYDKESSMDVFDLKGYVNSLMKKFLLDNEISDSYYHTSDDEFDIKIEKKYKNNILGKGGKLKKEILKEYNIKQDVYCFLIDIEVLKKIEGEKKKFTDLLKYPKIIRDFAFIFDKNVLAEDVINLVKESSFSLLKNIYHTNIFNSIELI